MAEALSSKAWGSEPSFAAVWDSEDDAAYDRL